VRNYLVKMEHMALAGDNQRVKEKMKDPVVRYVYKLC
jgi:hypothetical protein